VNSFQVPTQDRKLKIPSLEEIKKGIDELIGVNNWDRYKMRTSPKKFQKRLNELFLQKLGLMIHPIYLSDDKSLPKQFYRLRRYTSSFNERLISEYSYPPNHVVKSVQRANLPYYPVFYCSDNPDTAIRETVKNEVKEGEQPVYFMSEWSVRGGAKMNLCPFIFDNVAESNPYRLLSDINKKKLAEIMPMHSEDEMARVFEVFKFLSNLFLYENTYVISSYLAHINLYADHNLKPDVFIYPSVQTKRETVNFALHPNTVAEKLQLQRVFKLIIREYKPGQSRLTVSILSVGHNREGIIYWTDVTQDTERGREAISEIQGLFTELKAE
jgi:hypothetical protein